MQNEQELAAFVWALVAELHLQPCGPNAAFGEIQGQPVTMTVLASEPLSLMFAFKIVSPHPEDFDPPAVIQVLMAEGSAKVSLENGMAWLSLYNLNGVTREVIQTVVDAFADGLSAARLALPSGCATRDCQGDAQVVHIEGRTSRLCANCVEALYAEREQIEQQLNSASYWHSFGLPVIFLLAAGGWMVFWLLIDLVLQWLKVNVIVFDEFTTLVFIAILGAFGYGLGMPVGAFLRRSALAQISPKVMSVIAVLLVAFVGELFYVAICIFRMTGVVDIGLAWQSFVPFIRSYPGWWIAGKVISTAAIAAGAIVANEKQTAALRV